MQCALGLNSCEGYVHSTLVYSLPARYASQIDWLPRESIHQYISSPQYHQLGEIPGYIWAGFHADLDVDKSPLPVNTPRDRSEFGHIPRRNPKAWLSAETVHPNTGVSNVCRNFN